MLFDTLRARWQIPIMPAIERAVSLAVKTKRLRSMVGSGVDGSAFAHAVQARSSSASFACAGMTPAQALQAGTIVDARGSAGKTQIALIAWFANSAAPISRRACAFPIASTSFGIPSDPQNPGGVAWVRRREVAYRVPPRRPAK